MRFWLVLLACLTWSAWALPARADGDTFVGNWTGSGKGVTIANDLYSEFNCEFSGTIAINAAGTSLKFIDSRMKCGSETASGWASDFSKEFKIVDGKILDEGDVAVGSIRAKLIRINIIHAEQNAREDYVFDLVREGKVYFSYTLTKPQTGGSSLVRNAYFLADRATTN